MIETLQNEESNAAEFFSLKLIKETKEMYVFSVIFPQASKNIYGGVQGGMISAAMDEATFVSILRSQENIKKVDIPDIKDEALPALLSCQAIPNLKHLKSSINNKSS